MNDDSLTIEIVVPNSPQEVFDAVLRVDAWWSEDVGDTTRSVGDEFTFSDHTEHWCRFRVTDVVAPQRVVWHVLDSRLDFVEDRTEWNGTHVTFDIDTVPDGTRLRFVHHGLRPSVQCYRECSRGWDFYINRSLADLVTTGTGQPMPKP